MKILSVSLLVAISLTMPAYAQIGFSQNAWLGGTTVVVFNATDDRSLIKTFVNNEDVNRKPLKYGERWSHRFGGGLVFQYNPGQQVSLVITAKGCEDETTNFFVPPPDWAADQSLLGVLTLTQNYLDTNPTEKELGTRVKDIKKFLDGRLGRKQMRKELDEWFDAVKKVGLGFIGFKCDGPDIAGARVSFNTDAYNQSSRAIVVYVRGNRVNGYKMEGPDGQAF